MAALNGTGSMEDMAARIARMDRSELTHALLQIECTFPIDFSRAYLDSMSVERLRHLFLAAGLHERRRAGG